MGTLLAMFFLSCQEDKLRVEGPPFLVFGETVELRAANVVKDAVLVWRIADAPAGSVDTKPSFDPSTRFVRGRPR